MYWINEEYNWSTRNVEVSLSCNPAHYLYFSFAVVILFQVPTYSSLSSPSFCLRLLPTLCPAYESVITWSRPRNFQCLENSSSINAGMRKEIINFAFPSGDFWWRAFVLWLRFFCLLWATSKKGVTISFVMRMFFVYILVTRLNIFLRLIWRQ